MMNEMSEFNQNTRTLIVSFVVAIMALIPLRFVEVGNNMMVSQPMVLGETVESQIVLPNAEVKPELFEAPYNEEGKQVLGATTEAAPSCIDKEEANRLYEEYAKTLGTVNLNDLQKQKLSEEVLNVAKSVCR
jgi:hypothetical protein